MARIELKARLTIPEHVIHQKVDEEMVLLNLETGIYHGLSRTGTRLWEFLLEDENLHSVFQKMLKEYDVSAEQLEEDILRLVQELETHKLVIVGA